MTKHFFLKNKIMKLCLLTQSTSLFMLESNCDLKCKMASLQLRKMNNTNKENTAKSFCLVRYDIQYVSRIVAKALHSELLAELSGRFPSRNEYFVISEGRVERRALHLTVEI